MAPKPTEPAHASETWRFPSWATSWIDEFGPGPHSESSLNPTALPLDESAPGFTSWSLESLAIAQERREATPITSSGLSGSSQYSPLPPPPIPNRTSSYLPPLPDRSSPYVVGNPSNAPVETVLDVSFSSDTTMVVATLVQVQRNTVLSTGRRIDFQVRIYNLDLDERRSEFERSFYLNFGSHIFLKKPFVCVWDVKRPEIVVKIWNISENNQAYDLAIPSKNRLGHLEQVVLTASGIVILSRGIDLIMSRTSDTRIIVQSIECALQRDIDSLTWLSIQIAPTYLYACALAKGLPSQLYHWKIDSEATQIGDIPSPTSVSSFDSEQAFSDDTRFTVHPLLSRLGCIISQSMRHATYIPAGQAISSFDWTQDQSRWLSADVIEDKYFVRVSEVNGNLVLYVNVLDLDHGNMAEKSTAHPLVLSRSNQRWVRVCAYRNGEFVAVVMKPNGEISFARQDIEGEVSHVQSRLPIRRSEQSGKYQQHIEGDDTQVLSKLPPRASQRQSARFPVKSPEQAWNSAQLSAIATARQSPRFPVKRSEQAWNSAKLSAIATARLKTVLESGNIDTVERHLVRDLDGIKENSEYHWVLELLSAGYSVHDTAELLLDDSSGLPWIYFEHQALESSMTPHTDTHIPRCAHKGIRVGGQIRRQDEHTLLRSTSMYFAARRMVEELCGLGGVVPDSRDTSTWNGSVSFGNSEEYGTNACITYDMRDPSQRSPPESRGNQLRRLSVVLANFMTAAAVMHPAELCCDCFTVLVLGTQNCLHLRSIELKSVIALVSAIDPERDGIQDLLATSRRKSAASVILGDLLRTASSDINACALAVQFLCTGLLAYAQAHIGPFDPFFLDTPQQNLVLLGTHQDHIQSSISVRLVDLACLGEMIKQKVVVFSSGTGISWKKDQKYQVWTSPEDLLDTWGPGYYVHDKVNPKHLYALALRSGFIYRESAASLFHWADGPLPVLSSISKFELGTSIRVGATVASNVPRILPNVYGAGISNNDQCMTNETICRELSDSFLNPLDTHRRVWQRSERNMGLQITPPYAALTMAETWSLQAGQTLKESILKTPDPILISFLDEFWGLQVSLCTTICRRVSLRQLVIDLLPTFGHGRLWDELQTIHDGWRRAFEDGTNLTQWLDRLPEDHKAYLLQQLRNLLEQMGSTGYREEEKLFRVAWLKRDTTPLAFGIECREQTSWMKILADSTDCATFAYLTSLCLEMVNIRCQNVIVPEFPLQTRMLGTQVALDNSRNSHGWRDRLQRYMASTPVPVSSVSGSTFQLEDGAIYDINKMDGMLAVQVIRQTSAAGTDVAHLVVQKSTILNPKIIKRMLEKKRNIRETRKHGITLPGVIVRAGE